MSGLVSLESRVAEINNIVSDKGWELVPLTKPAPKAPRNFFEAMWLTVKRYLPQSEAAEPYPANSYVLVAQEGHSFSDLLAHRVITVDRQSCYLSQILLYSDSVRIRVGYSAEWKKFPIDGFYKALKAEGNLKSLKLSSQGPEALPRTIG